MKAAKKAKLNIPMCLAGILFCLTLISVHLTGGLYAKYTASGTGSDSARVITFGELTLTETGDFTSKTDSEKNEYKEFIIIPGVELEKKALLNFSGSESATYVFITLDCTGWKTTDGITYTKFFGSETESERTLSWSVDHSHWTVLDQEKYPGVYFKALSPNTKLENVPIILDNTIYVGTEITSSDLDKSTFPNLAIDIQASAVQSGGFASAQEAWESLSSKS